MKYRKLRIAWSVAWGVVAVLLIGLWARSYQTWDKLSISESSKTSIDFVSILGRWSIECSKSSHRGWTITHGEPDLEQRYVLKLLDNGYGFASFTRPGSSGNVFPQWVVVVVAAAAATLPWGRQLRWQFSLRTLLIATTLVAVGLGVVVWLR